MDSDWTDKVVFCIKVCIALVIVSAIAECMED